MQVSEHCYICGDKLRKINRKSIYELDKDITYNERCCIGVNHSLQFFVNEDSKKVELLKISLKPDYSVFIVINFYLKKCKLITFKHGNQQIIEINRLLYPDFPDLVKLKEKVKMYMVIS